MFHTPNICMPIAGDLNVSGILAIETIDYDPPAPIVHPKPTLTVPKAEPSSFASSVTSYSPLEGGIFGEVDGNSFMEGGYAGGGGYNIAEFAYNLVMKCHGQTFTVTGQPGGVYIDSIDLFFKNKPLDVDTGITVEIREVVKGMPGPKVVPHGTAFVNRNNIAVSEEVGGVTNFAPTNFRFDSLVYLKNDTTYCFIPSSLNSVSGFDMYMAKLGDNEVGTTTRIDKCSVSRCPDT